MLRVAPEIYQRIVTELLLMRNSRRLRPGPAHGTGLTVTDPRWYGAMIGVSTAATLTALLVHGGFC